MKRAKELEPLSLAPLSVEDALRATFATGPITDPALPSSRKKTNVAKMKKQKEKRSKKAKPA